jgi:ribosome-associated toxin RatA of RatAB toxin-antitoxin module
VPNVSKEVEVAASAESIMAIVADFESYPEWNEEIKGAWILARYDDGRPSQLRLDTSVMGNDGTYIQAVYYPADNQIQTVMQQGPMFSKQEQLFAAIGMGATTLLSVHLDVEVEMKGVPDMLVKKLVNDALEHLAGNLKTRAEQLAAS